MQEMQRRPRFARAKEFIKRAGRATARATKRVANAMERAAKSTAFRATAPLLALSLAASPAMESDLNPFQPSKDAVAEDKPPTLLEFEGKGKPFKSNLALGGDVFSNEAGSSVALSLNYGEHGGVKAGGISFIGDRMYPFASISLLPQWKLKLGRGENPAKMLFKFGVAGALTNINSVGYISAMGGIGFEKRINKDLTLWIGTVGGGALSAPKYDNIFFKAMGGASMQWDWGNGFAFQPYIIWESYFAADTAMGSAYVGRYNMQFQSIEAGILSRLRWANALVYGKYDAVQSEIGSTAGVNFEITDKVGIIAFVGGGVSIFNEVLGGGTEAMFMGGVRLVTFGAPFNTSWAFTHERMGPGGVPMFPDIRNPPHVPLTPEEIDYETEASARVLDYENFEDYANSFEGASEEQLILTTRWLAKTVEQIGYNFEAMTAMMSLKFFDNAVKRMAGRDHQDIYAYLHDYFGLIDLYGSFSNIPDELREQFYEGIAVCAGIHSLGMMFLSYNGIPAVAIAVNAPGGAHVITGAMPEGSTYLIDYGDGYRIDGHSIVKALAMYGRHNKVHTFKAQMWDENGYVGTLDTPAGKVLDNTFGIGYGLILKDFFFGMGR